MDIEKLIEQYQKASEYWRKNRTNFPDVAASYEAAATALSTLQAENEKLRAELEQVKRAARNDIPHNCHTCIDRSDPMCPGNKLKNSFNFQENCNKWTWCGPQKED